MEKKTKIIICLWVILFVAIFSAVKILERNGDNLFETVGNVSSIIYKDRVINRTIGADGEIQINKDTVSDEEKQIIEENIAGVKELFKGHEFLLEPDDDLDLSIDLKKLRDGKEYRYEQLLWNISLEKVQNVLPYSLVKDTTKTLVQDGYSYYISEYKHPLYNQTAAVTFAFYEDQLKVVSLDFVPEGKVRTIEKWYKGVIKKLCDVCGEEKVKTEDETTGYEGYQWSGDNSMLQVERIDSHVIISVGIREN